MLLPSALTLRPHINTETEKKKPSETLYRSFDSFWLIKFSSGSQQASHLQTDRDGGLVDVTKLPPLATLTHRVGPSASTATFFTGQKLNHLFLYSDNVHCPEKNIVFLLPCVSRTSECCLQNLRV